jgi:hypothetical protein
MNEDIRDCPESDLPLRYQTLLAKLAPLRKERDHLLKENRLLQEEVLALQLAQRDMFAGPANTSSPFPMPKELLERVAEYFKYDCSDLFFDLLGPELAHPSAVAQFYRFVIGAVQSLIARHF